MWFCFLDSHTHTRTTHTRIHIYRYFRWFTYDVKKTVVSNLNSMKISYFYFISRLKTWWRFVICKWRRSKKCILLHKILSCTYIISLCGSISETFKAKSVWFHFSKHTLGPGWLNPWNKQFRVVEGVVWSSICLYSDQYLFDGQLMLKQFIILIRKWPV